MTRREKAEGVRKYSGRRNKRMKERGEKRKRVREGKREKEK